MSCLFISLSYFISNNSYNIRQEICNYLQNNLENKDSIIEGITIKDILETENNPEEYIYNMRNESTYGGAIEIQTACNIWKLKINVKNIRDYNNVSIIEFLPIHNNYEKIVNISWNGGHYEPIL